MTCNTSTVAPHDHYDSILILPQETRRASGVFGWFLTVTLCVRLLRPILTLVQAETNKSEQQREQQREQQQRIKRFITSSNWRATRKDQLCVMRHASCVMAEERGLDGTAGISESNGQLADAQRRDEKSSGPR